MIRSEAPRKVLLAEFNEITWRLVAPLIERGSLPTFAAFAAAGARGSPIAAEVPPDLDPWISWTTLHTGRPQVEHGVRFLEQPPETVTGPRVADLAVDNGRSVGIFGSIMSWPPRSDARGFWVPSTFSPGPETHPENLRPLQELNLAQTRGHSPTAQSAKPRGTASQLLRLLPLGLRLRTIARIGGFLLRSRIRPHRAWEKVAFQPLMNLDVFEAQYRRHHPDFATFHTNHVAHYMHRYWRAMDPGPFRVKPSADEVRRYGPAVEHGYQVADRVLARLWKMAGTDTVVIVASGLGQQPYDAPEFAEGRKVLRLRDIAAVMKICGLVGHGEGLSMMAPQWNLRVPDSTRRAHAVEVLKRAWVGEPGRRLFALDVIGDTINFNIVQKLQLEVGPETPCVFPHPEQHAIPFADLCVMQDPTPKQGVHDRPGVLLMRGPGIRPGAVIDDCSNLDLAPTMLHLMGLPIPSYMTGRVLNEALDSPSPVSTSRTATTAASA